MNFKKIFAVVSCAALVTASSSIFSVTAFAAETVYAKTTADLHLRSGTGTNYSSITIIDENTKVTVIDRSNPNWLRIKLPDGTIGYSSADYLDIITDGYTTTAVNVRKGASTDYTVITTVPKNTKVDIIRYAGSSWAQVRLPDGTLGYMCTDYVTYTAPSSTQTSAAPALEMKLSVSSRKIAVGTTYTLKTSNNQGTVTWKSSDTKVAKVDSSGKVTAVAAGSVNITATDTKTNQTAKCTITVVKTEFTKITLSETSKTLTAGESFTLQATANNNSKNIKFKSSNTNAAKVDSNGKVTAVAAGSANITATDSTGVVTAVCKVTVKSKDSISLSSTSVSVNVGSYVTITANKSDSSMTLKWSSSNANVACVRGGRISGLSAGSAVITVSDSAGKVTAKCNVKVNSVSKGSLSISRSTYSTTAGKDFILTGKNGSSWSTSDSYVATVANNGVVHANHAGKAAVTYSDSYGNRAVCVVTVGNAAPVRAAYNSPNLAKTNQPVTLFAVTDKTVSSLRFKVDNGNSSVYVQGSKTEKNGRYIWTASYTPSNEGHFTTSAYATIGGKESTCQDAKGDFYVSNRSSSASYLGTHYVTDNLIGFLREKEGFVSKITDDSLSPGNLTVGYGCVMGEGNAFYNNMIAEEANALLINKLNHGDITSVLNTFFTDYKLKCNQQQFDALVSFGYNLGAYWMYNYDFGTEFKKFSSVYYGGSDVKDIRNMNRNTIVDNMTRFTRAGVGNVWGLLYRRIDELEIFFYGEYKNDGEKNKYNFSYPERNYVR